MNFMSISFPLQILREVEIHKNLVHKHVVRFYRFFEDNENMYIILELCNRKVRFMLVLYRLSWGHAALGGGGGGGGGVTVVVYSVN